MALRMASSCLRTGSLLGRRTLTSRPPPVAPVLLSPHNNVAWWGAVIVGGGLATACSAEWALLESSEDSAGDRLAKNLGHGVEVPDGLIDEVRDVDFPEADDDADHPFRDGPQRAAAYLVAAKRVAVRGLRYVAYSSDIGESLRPVRVRGRREGGRWRVGGAGRT